MAHKHRASLIPTYYPWSQHQGHVSHLSSLKPTAMHHSRRNTCIICTIGPASKSVEVLDRLIKAGMSIARLNFSHGSHEYHAEVIANVRAAEKLNPDYTVAIALDTKGPEIRTGELVGGGSAEVTLTLGREFTLTTDQSFYTKGTADKIFVDYVNITKVLKVGETVFIDDGLISLEVVAVGSDSLTTVIRNGGKLGSRKGVNLPTTEVDLPALSEKDLKDIQFGVEQKVDMVFASFIRKKEDLLDIRAALGEAGKDILIISKIENQEGLDKFDEVLEETDGVMVARGDMGIEIRPEKVFVAQKVMIAKCNLVNKPVIVATQMLESMVERPRPTRAEVSDVGNAVHDGTDCVMLSGETAKGKFPVEAVHMMSMICLEAEACLFHKSYFEELRYSTPTPADTATAIAVAAVDASFVHHASAIICLSTTGQTASLLAKYRPRCPIVTITRDPHVARIVHLYRGTLPVLIREPKKEPWVDDVEFRIKKSIEIAKSRFVVETGSTIIVVSGWRPGPAATNTIRILTVD
ncbi:Pyruvate kinase PKM-like [Oopsacas minuta]|uniref:Pyruvate kinase n=1 Tax=Oopsacas minuta TaxID=111878 RepID=A0AAV7K8F7_9METZ|nr:Pyruvate kinase PKM-like [Oopsacas minuta]